MKGVSLDLYPVTIQEARYSGTLEGGPWIIICGVENIQQQTDAIGSDGLCATFWENVRDNGPIVDEVDPAGGAAAMREIYAAAGDHPGTLYEEFLLFVDEHEAYQSPEWDHVWDDIDLRLMTCRDE